MANPIVNREVIAALRTRKALAAQVAFLLVAAALAWLMWPAGGLQDMGGKQAERLLGVLAIGELLMIVLLAPAFTAASLTLEREQNTLESLFATAIRPWQIASGKMLGSVALLGLLVLVGAPALAMPLLLGGVSGGQILAIVAMLLLTAVYVGMIGLLVSSLTHRSYRAIIVTYAILLVVCFLAALPAWPISGGLLARGGIAWQGTLHVLVSLSPLEAMLSLVWPDSAYSAGAAGMAPLWQTHIVVSVVMIALMAAALLIRLHRPIAPPRPREKLEVVERGRITARSLMFVVDPRKRKRPIRWWQNPVLVKECRTRPILQSQWLLRAFAICLIASLVLMLVATWSVKALVGESSRLIPTSVGARADTGAMISAVAGMMAVLVVLIGPAVAAGAICSDRESGVWDLIRATKVSSLRIASGKFQASIIPMLLLAVAMTPSLLLVLYFQSHLLSEVLRVLQVIGMTILFVTAAGMCSSSIFPRTSLATAATYALVATVGLLTLLVLLGTRYGLFTEQSVRWIFALNPVTAALDAAGNQAMQRYDLRVQFLRITGIATVGMFLITVARVFVLRRAD